MEIYNIDNSIQEFFSSNTTVTREECDAYVRTHYQGSVQAVPLQGCFSYTVVVGLGNDKIIQFRQETSTLDDSKMTLVRQAARGFLPDIQHHGTIGKEDERPLHIYEMNKMPGEMYAFANDASVSQTDELKQRQRNTVQDLARFFAGTWNPSQKPLPSEIAPLVAEYSYNLGRLRESLPTRFSGVIDSITGDQLAHAFSSLPLAITHEDLSELNFLIDPVTGRITGIVDWAEARVVPFGLGLWAVEHVLGFMDRQGWHYYNNHDELRSLFWETFRNLAKDFTDEHMKLVTVTRMIGLFRRHGFRVDGTQILGVIGKEDGSTLRYLDAFCRDAH